MTIPLLDAINRGDVSQVLEILAEDRPVDINDPYPWDASQTNSPFFSSTSIRPPPVIPPDHYLCTPINLAVLSGNKSVVRVLLQSGADPNREDSRNRNALVCALYGIDTLKMASDTFSFLSCSLPEYLDLIRILIPHMIISSLNKPLSSLRGTSILCFACYLGKLDAVNFLLNCEHIAINAVDCKGATALMYAVREGHQAIVRVLVNHHASPDLTNQEGFSSIQYARNAPIITFELEKALALSRLQKFDPNTFSSAILPFRTEFSSILSQDHVSSLPDPTARELSKSDPIISELNQSFIHHVQSGQVDKVQQLILAYFKPPLVPQQASLLNFHDKVTGLTPAHKAIYNGNEMAMLETLYLAGADINSTSWSGRTPLHHLCILAVQDKAPNRTAPESPNPAPQLFSLLASRLIDLGASVTVVDKKGKTPLHYAAKCNESLLPLVQVLLLKGADPIARDHSKRTPAECADSPIVASTISAYQASESPPKSLSPRSQTPISTKIHSSSPALSQAISESSTYFPSLNSHIQKFLDRYRLLDSEVSLEWIPVLRDLKALVHSRVIAGSSRHQFRIEDPQLASQFHNLVSSAGNHMAHAFQLYADLFQKRELIVDELHARYDLVSQKKDSLVALWRQADDPLPQFKSDLRSLTSRLVSFNSECSFLISSFTNKRSTFVQEFQRQLAVQQSSVKSNNRDLNDLVEAEAESTAYDSDPEGQGSPLSPSTESESAEAVPSKALSIDHLEQKLQALSLNSKNVQIDMTQIKSKLSELRDQKNILVSEFSSQFSASETKSFDQRSSRGHFLISLSDLAFQAEMLTSQHEKLLAVLEKRIFENERLKMDIYKVRRELYKLSPFDYAFPEPKLKETSSQRRVSSSSSTSQALSLVLDAPPASQKLIDLMLQIQAMDLALFSLNTWIPYRAGGLKSIVTLLDSSIERLSIKVEEFRSNMTCIDQHTSQLRQSIQQKEAHMQQTLSSRESWLNRVKLSVEEAQNLSEDQYSSHSLKHWPWDFETAFRQCQVSNLEESCLILASDLDSHQSHLQSTQSKVASFVSQLKFQDQYLKTKLYSSDPKKYGALHEIQYLETYLEKIKQRDTLVQNFGRSNSWGHSKKRRPTSIFGTPELIPSSPTSSSSLSIDSNSEGMATQRHLSVDESRFMRPSALSICSDSGLLSESIREHRSRLTGFSEFSTTLSQRARRHPSVDVTYPGRGNSLLKGSLNEECSSLPGSRNSFSRIRRTSSSYGLHLANSTPGRPLSQYSVASSSGASSINRIGDRRTLRSCGSMAALSMSAFSSIRTSPISQSHKIYSSPRLPSIPASKTNSRFSTLPSRVRPPSRMALVQTSPSVRISRSNSNAESRPNLRRILSELHPKAPSDSLTSRSTEIDSKKVDKGTCERLGGLLSDARREVDLLERLTSSGSGTSDLDRRQRALLVKKRVQVRQFSLALQKLGQPLTTSSDPHRHSTLLN